MLARLFRRKPTSPTEILDHHINQKREASARYKAWQAEQEQLTRRVFAIAIAPQLRAFNNRSIEIRCKPEWDDDVLDCNFEVLDFGRAVAKFRAHITPPGNGGPTLSIQWNDTTSIPEAHPRVEYDLDRAREVDAFMHALSERALSRISLHD